MTTTKKPSARASSRRRGGWWLNLPGGERVGPFETQAEAKAAGYALGFNLRELAEDEAYVAGLLSREWTSLTDVEQEVVTIAISIELGRQVREIMAEQEAEKAAARTRLRLVTGGSGEEKAGQ